MSEREPSLEAQQLAREWELNWEGDSMPTNEALKMRYFIESKLDKFARQKQIEALEWVREVLGYRIGPVAIVTEEAIDRLKAGGSLEDE